MSDTVPKRPVKRVAKKAAGIPIPPEPSASDFDELFVIEPIIRLWRYMFQGGQIMDVSSPYGSNSTDRELVLKEAQRRWGGKKDDWKIVGSTELPELPELPEP